ncbi:hypothetical protein ASE14_00925 [Agromyces sp. Root81]|uniref:hypothetical protein n=1 Tax=Agromyces sp. Root81 TaxID=1736601 RepID=UPI0006FDA6B6|nr:hypothetical protein [Agromyces sp. Root81]KRC62434.1 hypothetical protein ASE14_00925 [Agromyces sp. Root81]
MSITSAEWIIFWFLVVAGVPALLAVIWRSLKQRRRFRAARSMCRWVSTLWVVATIVALIVVGAVAGHGSWSALAVWMAIIIIGVAVLPTLIMTLILSTNEFYPELREH